MDVVPACCTSMTEFLLMCYTPVIDFISFDKKKNTLKNEILSKYFLQICTSNWRTTKLCGVH